MRESELERYFVKRIRAEFPMAEVRKLKWIGRMGAPDRVMMYKGRTLWVELKAPNGSLRPAQLREHVRMYEAGQQVIVLWNVDAIEKLVGWARSFA